MTVTLMLKFVCYYIRSHVADAIGTTALEVVNIFHFIHAIMVINVESFVETLQILVCILFT